MRNRGAGDKMQDDGPQPMPSRMDEAQFSRLLQLAGPVDGAELLQRLTEDLRKADVALATAIPAADLSAVRETTHVLIAVAGAIGAAGLAEAARQLNSAAQLSDSPLPADVTALVRADLAALRKLVQRWASDGAAG